MKFWSRLFGKEPAKQTTEATHEPMQQKPASNIAFDTLSNSTFGFSFIYPEGWQREIVDSALIISPPDAKRLPAPAGSNDTCAIAITLIIARKADITSPEAFLEDWARINSAGFPDHQLLKKSAFRLTSGHAAIELSFGFTHQNTYPFGAVAVRAVRQDILFSLDVSGLRSQIESREAMCHEIVTSLRL